MAGSSSVASTDNGLDEGYTDFVAANDSADGYVVGGNTEDVYHENVGIADALAASTGGLNEPDLYVFVL